MESCSRAAGWEARTDWDERAEVRAFRDFQSSWDLEIAGRAALPQKQTFINFFSEEARSFVVWRKKDSEWRGVQGRRGDEVCFGELRQGRRGGLLSESIAAKLVTRRDRVYSPGQAA